MGNTAAVEVCSRTRIFTLAESLGAVESLIEHPARMTHASTSGTSNEVPGELVRLSVGLETIDDLLQDLEDALMTLPAGVSRIFRTSAFRLAGWAAKGGDRPLVVAEHPSGRGLAAEQARGRRSRRSADITSIPFPNAELDGTLWADRGLAQGPRTSIRHSIGTSIGTSERTVPPVR